MDRNNRAREKYQGHTYWRISRDTVAAGRDAFVLICKSRRPHRPTQETVKGIRKEINDAAKTYKKANSSEWRGARCRVDL